tara:strand:+ start:11263 stop:11754 length:492 start_codon:yes stop_codon:yes gene_type:complete
MSAFHDIPRGRSPNWQLTHLTQYLILIDRKRIDNFFIRETNRGSPQNQTRENNMAEKRPDDYHEPLSSEEIAALREEVTGLIESCRGLLDQDGLAEVDHYLNHNEPEMAFEGLLIELIQANKVPDSFDVDQWKRIAQTAGLPAGGVFDEDIWNKFCIWLDDAE